jgi:peptide subunit release factor 1 (eRF1)
MTVPSLSVSVHDRYTPELRDRIIEKLRAAPVEREYHLLTPAGLRALAEIHSPQVPVLSLYLQLTPDRRIKNAWQTVFHSLADAALKPIDDRRKRVMLREEFDRIEQALIAELPELGRGVAFFVCRTLGFWRQIAVPLPLPDRAHLGPRPYIRPLAWTRDEHDRFVLALLSQEHNRFFISQIGQVEEVFQVKSGPLRKILTDRVPQDRSDVIVVEAMKNEARIIAHAVGLVVAQFEGRHLLLSGAPELQAAVVEHLPKPVQQLIGADFAVEVHARPAAVAAAAEPAQRTIEAREERATVQRLLDAGPKGSAWGEQPTLDALREGRVMTLVVDGMSSKPGARCRNCGGLWAAPTPSCAACGSDAVEQVEDVVELAIERALDQKGYFELVCSDAARQAMTRIGSLAALLRW